jgi:two-component sensor histidine kinase
MRGQRAGDPDARRHLVWIADAIGSVGALEQKRQGASVDFAAYLEEMGPVWRRRQGPNAAAVVVEAAPFAAADNTASTLALIAQELVGNALAHGFVDGRPGVVTVRLQPADGRCDLTVSDDGCGFDPGSEAARERFGLWLVRSLAAQVRGEFTLTSSPGVTGRLTFPV